MTSSLKRFVSSRVKCSGWEDLWIEINSSLEMRRSILRRVTSGVDAISKPFGKESIESRGEEGLK